MAEPTDTNATTPAPAGPAANPPAAVTQPVATGDTKIDDRLERVLKHNEELKRDLDKIRQREAEREKAAAEAVKAAEAKLIEQGDFAKFAKMKEDEARQAAARVAELEPLAQRLTAHEKRVTDKLNAAKAAGDLPSHIARAIDIAQRVDVDEAFDILSEYRASTVQAAPAKQPAPPAPAQGAAPASQPAVNLSNPKSLADLQTLKAKDPSAFQAFIGGQSNSLAQSFHARLTRAGSQKAS